MKAVACALWVCVVVMASARLARAAPRVEVAITASDLEVVVGDIIDVVVTIDHPAGLRVKVPGDWPGFSEIGRAQMTTDSGEGRARTEVELAVMALALGKTQLGPIAATYTEGGEVRSVWSEPLLINIAGARAPGDDELRDIAGPVPAKRRATWPIYAGVVVIAFAIGGVALVMVRRRRRGVIRPVRNHPPDEVALERLGALEMSGALDAGDRTRIFVEVSEIIRTYLGGRYGFPGRELTTGEVESALAQSAGADVAARLLGDWLATCDLVKYAGHDPSPADARQALDRARLVVERTRIRA